MYLLSNHTCHFLQRRLFFLSAPQHPQAAARHSTQPSFFTGSGGEPAAWNVVFLCKARPLVDQRPPSSKELNTLISPCTQEAKKIPKMMLFCHLVERRSTNAVMTVKTPWTEMNRGQRRTWVIGLDSGWNTSTYDHVLNKSWDWCLFPSSNNYLMILMTELWPLAAHDAAVTGGGFVRLQIRSRGVMQSSGHFEYETAAEAVTKVEQGIQT